MMSLDEVPYVLMIFFYYKYNIKLGSFQILKQLVIIYLPTYHPHYVPTN